MSKVMLSFALVMVEGVLDRSATLQGAEDALTAHEVRSQEHDEAIDAALVEVFDEVGTKGATMPVLTFKTLVRLNAQGENYAVLEDRIGARIRANASPDRAAGALYRIGKGKGATTCRWSDVQDKPATAKK